jgi:hypothetical protein
VNLFSLIFLINFLSGWFLDGVVGLRSYGMSWCSFVRRGRGGAKFMRESNFFQGPNRSHPLLLREIFHVFYSPTIQPQLI